MCISQKIDFLKGWKEHHNNFNMIKMAKIMDILCRTGRNKLLLY